MPVELGLALYRSHITHEQQSTSDVNGIDPQVHNGTIKGLMSGLRNIFRQRGDVTTVPEMLASYRAVRRKLPDLRKNAGSKSLFEAAIFQDLTVAALVESQRLITRRRTRSAADRRGAEQVSTSASGPQIQLWTSGCQPHPELERAMPTCGEVLGRNGRTVPWRALRRYATRSSAMRRFLGLTTISTSCPSATRKRMRRSTE